MELTPHKDEEPLQGMKLEEHIEDKYEKHIGKLIKKNPKIKGDRFSFLIYQQKQA